MSAAARMMRTVAPIAPERGEMHGKRAQLKVCVEADRADSKAPR
jgi:hypothetical protein